MFDVELFYQLTLCFYFLLRFKKQSKAFLTKCALCVCDSSFLSCTFLKPLHSHKLEHQQKHLKDEEHRFIAITNQRTASDKASRSAGTVFSDTISGLGLFWCSMFLWVFLVCVCICYLCFFGLLNSANSVDCKVYCLFQRTVSFRSRKLPPNSVWMEDAKLKGLQICHPEVF